MRHANLTPAEALNLVACGVKNTIVYVSADGCDYLYKLNKACNKYYQYYRKHGHMKIYMREPFTVLVEDVAFTTIPVWSVEDTKC